MSEILLNKTGADIAVTSSLANIRPHHQAEAGAFACWHFDALSDDGREALVITFHDNFALSPRYRGIETDTKGNTPSTVTKVPAVSLTYSIAGRVFVRTVNEFHADQVVTTSDGTGFSIGASSFQIDTVSYGSGFILHLDLLTARKRRIEAELEWLFIESNLSKIEDDSSGAAALWNLVAPRSDVSGRLSLMGRNDRSKKIVHFRGTGYHDHLRSDRSLVQTVGSRFWGHAHFIDSTAVFDHHETEDSTYSKLFLIRDGKIHERELPGSERSFTRDRHGLKLPESVSFLSRDNIQLRVEPASVIQSGPFATTILGDMTLMLQDGKPRHAVGIAEIIRPALTRSRLFRWLADARIGKNGKGPLF
jgi:carotenoid 1,2-hydratase